MNLFFRKLSVITVAGTALAMSAAELGGVSSSDTEYATDSTQDSLMLVPSNPASDTGTAQHVVDLFSALWR